VETRAVVLLWKQARKEEMFMQISKDINKKAAEEKEREKDKSKAKAKEKEQDTVVVDEDEDDGNEESRGENKKDNDEIAAGFAGIFACHRVRIESNRMDISKPLLSFVEFSIPMVGQYCIVKASKHNFSIFEKALWKFEDSRSRIGYGTVQKVRVGFNVNPFVFVDRYMYKNKPRLDEMRFVV
jgi:hypothetical protein